MYDDCNDFEDFRPANEDQIIESATEDLTCTPALWSDYLGAELFNGHKTRTDWAMTPVATRDTAALFLTIMYSNNMDDVQLARRILDERFIEANRDTLERMITARDYA